MPIESKDILCLNTRSFITIGFHQGCHRKEVKKTGALIKKTRDCRE
jgi:hypothetical protein